MNDLVIFITASAACKCEPRSSSGHTLLISSLLVRRNNIRSGCPIERNTLWYLKGIRYFSMANYRHHVWTPRSDFMIHGNNATFTPMVSGNYRLFPRPLRVSAAIKKSLYSFITRHTWIIPPTTASPSQVNSELSLCRKFSFYSTRQSPSTFFHMPSICLSYSTWHLVQPPHGRTFIV